jgi:hypothetical protein
MTYVDQGQRPLKREIQFLDQKHRNGWAVEKQRCAVLTAFACSEKWMPCKECSELA